MTSDRDGVPNLEPPFFLDFDSVLGPFHSGRDMREDPHGTVVNGSPRTLAEHTEVEPELTRG